MQTALIELFDRDFKRLEKLIDQCADENHLWKLAGSIKNSSGHLTLHLCGNVRHFIGNVLGNNGYERFRDLEFNSSPVPASKLKEELSVATQEVLLSLAKLTSEDLEKIYPINVFGREMTTEYFILHLYGHFNYHLGQIDYLLRSFHSN